MDFELPAGLKREIEEKGGWKKIKESILKKDIKRIEYIVRSISDEKRLKILYALSEQKMCVCMLVDLMNCSYSKCSYHISKLKDAGLIKASKKGNYMVYSLTPAGKRLIKELEKIQ